MAGHHSEEVNLNVINEIHEYILSQFCKKFLSCKCVK